MTVTSFLQVLTQNQRYHARIAHVEVLPEREGSFASLSPELPEELSSYLATRHLQLYSHQCKAVEAIRQGKNILLTTATASGKTLGFMVPVFEQLIEDRNATALFLYPTKALSNDQLKVAREIEMYTGAGTAAAIYDGDTPQARRSAIRGHSRLIITNPYELHQVLPWHYKWAGFFQHLRIIVIDEAHRYRGIIGSHIALLLRRLQRLCQYYGSSPRFILSSATLANPEEFARHLIGMDFMVITGDGSPQGRKYFVLYNPFFDSNGGHSTHQEIKGLFLAGLDHGLQTLCFTSSRRLAELIARWSREELERSHPGWDNAVVSYRAGYLPEERRAIEDRVKEGVVRGVVSTNALELGVDIGSLDAVILSGFPGTLLSTWQQAGRAGRRGGDSVAVMVGFQNPLDQYFMHHPATFFSRTMEHAIIDETNPYVLAGHLLCAAAELPFVVERDSPFFGESSETVLRSFEACNLVRRTPHGWIYVGRGRAADAVKLGSLTSETFRVVCDGRVLETMDRSQAFREGHRGAILLHGGETFLVTELDLEGHLIRVKETDVEYYTEPIKTVDLTVMRVIQQGCRSDVPLRFGEVEVSEQYTGYRIIRGGSVIGHESLELPALQFTTKAFWFEIPDRIMDVMEYAGDTAGGLHGAEHAIIGMMPLHVLCDRWDIGGLSTPCFAATEQPTVFVYDGHEGGIGLAEKAYALFGPLIRTSYELVRDCSCTSGCPACIFSPKCGNDNRPLDKNSTHVLLREMNAVLEDRNAQHS